MSIEVSTEATKAHNNSFLVFNVYTDTRNFRGRRKMNTYSAPKGKLITKYWYSMSGKEPKMNRSSRVYMENCITIFLRKNAQPGFNGSPRCKFGQDTKIPADAFKSAVQACLYPVPNPDYSCLTWNIGILQRDKDGIWENTNINYHKQTIFCTTIGTLVTGTLLI